MQPQRLILYGRPNCCLCDQALARIEKVVRERNAAPPDDRSGGPPVLVEYRDISNDPDLIARWGEKIPVVALDGEVVLVSRISEYWLRKVLKGERSERLQNL